MSIEPTRIDAALAQYVRDHAGGRDRVLREVEEKTSALGSLARMQTAPEQAAFLEMLVRTVGARRAVEVGTFTGYGAIRIARGLTRDGRLLCLEIDPERAATARENVDAAGIGDRVEIMVGPAIESLRSLPGQPTFDFAYLDADKTGYPEYYDELVPRLTPGGLLAIDNVFMAGRIVDPKDEGTVAVAGLNDRIMDDGRVDSVMLGMADGITLVRRREDRD
ncbi:MAG TPA: O-methyltransferase [Solirubrobacterales bacterium]|nr:O-methyltransferase [Solirubrobacterales bacterium]